MKKQKKIKIFLGGYVNFPNAQNINCDNIAKHLDKERFEVHVMYSSKKPMDRDAYKKAGIHPHKLIHHRYIWFWNKLLTMWAANCDIYYLPKMESADVLFAKLFRRTKKVLIASVEGVVGKQVPADDPAVVQYLGLMDSYYSISNCIQESIMRLWGKKTEVLHLGVESADSLPERKTEIRNIVWTGSQIQRKRPQYLLEVAKRFPQLGFTMIGDGDMMPEIEKRIAEEGIGNVKLTGRIPNDQVYEHMRKADLLLMTSEFEGLPKVIQEAAQCGLPSIYMAENYTVDFLTDGVNGYGVYSIDEMCEKLEWLLSEPQTYRAMSAKAHEVIQEYTWERLIPKYEDYFLRILEKKRLSRRDGEHEHG